MSERGPSDVEALERIVGCIDLTSLEGSETPDAIGSLCAKAIRPDPWDVSVPSVAAVCVYPRSVPVAVERLRGSDVRVAAVAGGFPTGLGPLDARLNEIRSVVEMGADEVDVVLNRSLILSGRRDAAFQELLAARRAAGPAVLKIILEVGELRTDEHVRDASALAMSAGADFLKTSTGKIAAGATLPAAHLMMEAILGFFRQTGRRVGFKAAGGIRGADAALGYLAAARDLLGPDWPTPERFRIGASSLLDDAVRRLRQVRSAHGDR